MRFPTAISIIFHVVLAIVVLRLPSPAASLSHRPVEFEIRASRVPEPQVETAKVDKQPEPTKEKEKPKLEQMAMREPQQKAVTTLEPPKKPEEKPQQTPAPHDLSKIDLNVKALPGDVGAFAVPSNPTPHANNTGMRTYDAGNPFTGKLTEAKEDRYPLKQTKDGLKYSGPRFSALIQPDGTVKFEDKYINFDGKNSGISFDLTDIAMHAHHEDPNRHEKMRFMEQTEAIRNKLLAEARRDNMQQSIARLPDRLDEIWQSSRAAKARRHELFAMWKDTLDVEAERADGAHEARLVIEEYIRHHLPQGADDAFTDEELAACNHGLKIPFHPYR